MEAPLRNRLREHRLRRGWSQAELARRAGLSRAGVSAAETGRLVPSTVAALALARALGVRVEELFALGAGGHAEPEWAWSPLDVAAPSWTARVGERLLRFPAEPTLVGALPVDADAAEAERTVVLAGCDPAVGLLADALRRDAGLRLLPLSRASGRALELLAAGAVHLAGVHLGDNEREVRARLGPGHALVRVATWDEGLALRPALGLRSVRAALGADLRWVGREEGSGARRCLERLFAEGGGARELPRHLARDHAGVAEAIRGGWAEAGVCVRLCAEQVGLDFHVLEREAYDLVTTAALLETPPVRAALAAIRSLGFRRQLRALAGYDADAAGDLREVS